MPEMNLLGRLLVLAGVILFLLGIILIGAGKAPWPGWLGRLPGDILIQRKNFTFYFPVSTGLLLSLLASAVIWLLTRR